MGSFSGNEDGESNIGELILESLLNSSIISITNLNLSGNESWFRNIDILAELISR